MAALDPATVKVGDALPELAKRPIERDDLKRYAAASGDPNPMHLDDEIARSAGYPGVFAHGMLSMGYLGDFVVRAGGGPETVRTLRARFAKLTWPGDQLTCRGVVTAVRDEGATRLVECDVWTEMPTGERKVTGTATLALPLPG
jgi:acyl dehydratase